MKTAIKGFRAEYSDEHSGFVIYVDRDEENVEDQKPLRAFHHCISALSNPDPEEARVTWGLMIHAPKDMDGDVADPVLIFEREAQAKRVAKKAEKELKDLQADKPILEGIAAQIAYMLAGGKARGLTFGLDMLRGKIAGA